MTVGIDVSDGPIRAVRVDKNGRVLARSDAASRARDSASAVRAVLDALRQASADRDRAGIAVSWPGDELPSSIVTVLEDEGLKSPTTVDAGHAAALAEAWCGAAQGVTNAVTFAIGEHVTAGLLVDGEVLRGAHGYAGSVGWLSLNPVEREDYRRYGGLEAEVGAAGIVRRLVWRIKSGDESPIVDQVGGDLTRITADDVFKGARSGDGVCTSVIRDTARYVGMAVSNLAAVLDPDAIVLGGTLAALGDMMLEAVRLECSRRLRPPQAKRIRVLLSTLGPDAVAIGAARAALLARR